MAMLPTGTIHAYGSQPRSGWVPRRDPAESPSSPTFGVELEYQRGPSRDRVSLTGDELVATAAPRGFWHAQHDGSVSGPEFASQPASLAVWRSHKAHVATFMRTAVHGNWRSHDGAESCSMHVNVGRSAFGDADHLARFIRLITVNPRWSTRLAQRTHAQVASWARFDGFRTMADCTGYAGQYWRNGIAYTGHSAAVNLENDGRIEVRLPRGTLRVDRFYGKLEWIAAMVEYTRDPANRPAPGAFCQWVLARRVEYAEFFALLTDLMPSRVAPRPVTAPATPARTSGHNGPCRVVTSTYPYAECVGSAGHFGRHADSNGGTWA
jgi:hypothetical protein